MSATKDKNQNQCSIKISSEYFVNEGFYDQMKNMTDDTLFKISDDTTRYNSGS